MDSRTLRRWALYALLVVANILILTTAFGSKVRVSAPTLPKSQPTTNTFIYMPLVSKPSEPMTLQQNHTSYIEQEAEQQVLHIVGEVANQSGKNVRNILLEASLFDRSGALLSTIHGNLALNLLPDGATTCFNLATPLPEGYEKYELKVLNSETVEGDETAVESYITNERFDRDFGWYTVNGVATYQIGNISGDVAVAATFYDKQKMVIGCELSFANFPETEVPEPGVFSFYYMGGNAPKVTSAQTLAVNVPIGME